jgi:hypothetical protein
MISNGALKLTQKEFPMKSVLFAFFMSSLFSVVQAATVLPTEDKVSPSSVDQVIRLVDKDEPGSSHKKVSILVTDHGMSTDVSPRHTIYLAYASLAEMGNISVDFEITNQAFRFTSATRKAAGIYEVRTLEYRADFVDVVYTIDARKMFSDEKKLREECEKDGGFCDGDLKTSIIVTESVKPSNF